MDIAEAFGFVTEDERWLGKLGIGALISLLSFLILPIVLLVGYLVGIARNVMDAADRPLPEWEDFGTLFRDGLAIIVAQLVYTLPFWLLTCVALVATAGLGGLTGSNEDALAAGIMATYGLVICLGLLFAVVLFFLSPAIVIQYVRTNEFGSTFRFGEVISIARANMGDILITALASFVAGFLLNIVIGVIALIPCLGWIAAPVLALAGYPWMMAVTGHLYGQIAAKGNKLAQDFGGSA